MGTASLHLDDLGPAWRSLWYRLSRRQAAVQGCIHLRGVWGQLRHKYSVQLGNSRYCLEDCLEPALGTEFERLRGTAREAAVQHRIPLGLLLLSRQQITAEQLRTALEAQEKAGHGRLGEWLLALGFATEGEITAALARQWSCPVLRPGRSLPRACRSPQLPSTLLHAFALLPVDYVESTATLHLAFGEGVDHGVLYAIERMTESHTAACMAQASFVRESLRTMPRQREGEVVFECPTDAAERSRIVRSYGARLSASEIRLADCGPYTWVRLFRPARPPMDLLFRAGAEAVSGAGLKYSRRMPMASMTGASFGAVPRSSSQAKAETETGGVNSN